MTTKQLAARVRELEATCDRMREWGRTIADDNLTLYTVLADMLARFAPSDDGLGEAEIACATRARAVLGDAR